MRLDRPRSGGVGVLGVLAAVIVSAARVYGGDVVVHEWGTFTTHHGPDGEPVLWQPLQTVSDLPGFVYKASARATRKNTISGTVRMETPVLYFYTTRQQTLSVGVGFPSGLISEWYPRARTRRGAGVRWPRVTLLPGATVALPEEAAPSHYYPARATDAVPLRSRDARGMQHEKFLFYRGVGTFDVPLRVRQEGDAVRIRTVGPDLVVAAVLVECRGEGVGFVPVDLGAGEIVVDRPVPTADGLSGLEAALRVSLTGGGLHGREADAMLATWRATWSEEGLRVLYVVPRRLTDAVLPLTIRPVPLAVVRVLVGRAEVLPPAS